MSRRRLATGSCFRCRRSLDLASVKVDGVWYGRAACATGGACPLEGGSPLERDPDLITRPVRAHGKPAPKELRRAE